LLELYIVQLRRDAAREQMQAIGKMRPLTLKESVFGMVAVERVTTPDSGSSLTRSYLDADPEDQYSRLALARYLIEGEKYSDAVDVLEAGPEQLQATPQCRGLL